MVFGLRVLSLPDCKVIREIGIPEKQLVQGRLSPHGHFIAVNASPIEGLIHRAVVIDGQTGQTVFDQRMRPNDIAFFPDSRRVAFSVSHHDKRAPVKIAEISGRT